MEDEPNYKIGLKSLSKIFDEYTECNKREKFKKNTGSLWLMNLIKNTPDGMDIGFAGSNPKKIKAMFKELSKFNSKVDFNEDEMKVKYGKKTFTVGCGINLQKMINSSYKSMKKLSQLSHDIHSQKKNDN